MKNNYRNHYVTNKNEKDVFGAYLLDGASFEGNYDIPIMNIPSEIHLPSKLIAYSRLNTLQPGEYTYCHFYQDDYSFDGKFGVWNSLKLNTQFKKGFNLDKFKNVYAIICPDFSLYYDMPIAMQIWNIYRSRAVGYFLTKLWYVVIPNVRWTDKKSYEYCFDGLQKNSIVAVSTLGCLRSRKDRSLFLPGLKELIRRISPKHIILYGTLTSEIIDILTEAHQSYVFFPSQISEAMEAKYGHES